MRIRNAATGKIKPVAVEFNQISPVLSEKIINDARINLERRDSQYLQLVKKIIVNGIARIISPYRVIIRGA